MVNSFQKGFTLIEVVLVIALLGVTASLLVTLVNPAQQFKKANDAQRKTDLHQLQAAFELYRADQGEYPAVLAPCGQALSFNSTTYLQKIPCDPKNTGQHVYTYVPGAGNSTYTLVACLENTSDPKRDLPPVFTGNNSIYCTGGTTNWSYTLTNP